MPTTSVNRLLNKLIEDESLEPKLGWGLRMAITAMVPVIWGISTQQVLAASWITLTAECICWVELKGAFTQRLWILVTGMVLALLFAWLGAITAPYMWVSIIAIFFVCFLAGLFKNLGERGAGLAICVYIMYIVSNAHPEATGDALRERMGLVAIGGLWALVVGVASSIFMPVRQPYRRSIALIWKANASLLEAVAKGWNGKGVRNGLRTIYEKEKQVRAAIDSSLQLYQNRYFQTRNVPLTEQELAKLRKQTALVGIHIVAMGDELSGMKQQEVPKSTQLKIYEALFELKSVVNHLATYTISLKQESLFIVLAAIDKANLQVAALEETLATKNAHQSQLERIVQLYKRSIRIIESGLAHLEKVGNDKPVYSSYSFLKTLYLLQPRRWFYNTQLLFNFNTHTIRYILRSSLAAAIAVFIYKWLQVDRGYWFAFTVVLVMQPYFGATLKKAFDRIMGTLAGGIVGGLLIHMSDVPYLRECMLFVSFVSMVYFIRTNYALAAFFITLSLVLLFDVEHAANNEVIFMRALSTIGGACLSILAGFALLPDWDSKWLPKHIAQAITANYNYFIAGFFSEGIPDWTKMKRLAETANSNAFDSFNRYLSEPTLHKRPVMSLYHIILNNVHITRELNNIHVDDEVMSLNDEMPSDENSEELLQLCLQRFHDVLKLTPYLDEKSKPPSLPVVNVSHPAYTTQQLFYLERMQKEITALYQNLQQLIAHNDASTEEGFSLS